MTIIVNGRHCTGVGPFISFTELVMLAGMPYAETVTYIEAPTHSCRRKGIVRSGESVVPTAEMIFNVAATGAA